MSKLPEANGHRSVRRCPRTVSMVMLRAPGLAYNRRMKEKEQIVENWLPRYTGVPLEQFGEHILLTNFGGYLRSEEHTSELQSLMRISYAVFCLKKKKTTHVHNNNYT